MTELQAYLYQLDWVLDQQLLCLAGLSPADLAWAPPSPGANTASAIVAHTLAVTASFAQGIVGGTTLRRDRPAEFRASFADVPAVATAIADLRDQLRDLATRSIDLATVVLPEASAWGSPPDGPMPQRQILAEALRHAAIHLGELRFTRSLLDARQSG